MTSGSILIVCTGNTCRSPAATGLLRHHLGTQQITIRSAGTHAAVGRRPVPEAISTVLELTGEELRHTAVQITAGAASSADLVLTMTKDQRSFVTALAPRSVRRTFTLLEFARITQLLASDGTYPTLSDFVRACTPQRRLANAATDSMDIDDPYGGPPAGYVRSFDLIAAAVDQTAAAIIRHVVDPPPPPTDQGARIVRIGQQDDL